MPKVGHFGLVAAALGARASCPQAGRGNLWAPTGGQSPLLQKPGRRSPIRSGQVRPPLQRLGGRDARAPRGPYIVKDEPNMLRRMIDLHFAIGG